MLLKLSNRSGMVMVVVLAAIIVMSVFATNIVSQNLSQSMSGQEQVDQIKAQELAIGAFWKAYSDVQSGAAMSVPNETLDGKTFTVTLPASMTPSALSRDFVVTY